METQLIIKNYFRLLVLLIVVLARHPFSVAQPAAISVPDTIEYGSNQALGKFVSLRGFRMYYEIYGQGEPLLMIHGNSGSIESFSNQIPFFSSRYKVIAVDSRAQGKSVDLQDSLSFEMMADDFSALLDQLQIDSSYVLGWSDGGINGLLLAIRHPEKVKKLAITGANLWPDSSAINGKDYMWGFNYYDTLGKMPQTPENIHSRKLVGLDLFQPNITIQQLQHIKCPTLVIGGDHDIILTGHTMLIAKFIPGAFLWIVPNSGHGTLIDHKDRFNEVVDDFFKNNLVKE